MTTSANLNESSSSRREHQPPRPERTPHREPKRGVRAFLGDLVGKAFGPRGEQQEGEKAASPERLSADERLQKLMQLIPALGPDGEIQNKNEMAALQLLSNLAQAAQRLEAKEPVNGLEAEINQKKVGVADEMNSLTLPLQQLPISDLDQLVGMLKMVRSGKILFQEGVSQILQGGTGTGTGTGAESLASPSEPLREVLHHLATIHRLEGVSKKQIQGDSIQAAFAAEGASQMSEYLPSGGERSGSPEQNFATDAMVLCRLLHPLGDLPYSKVPGRKALGFQSAKSGLSFGAGGLVEVEIPKDGPAIVSYYSLRGAQGAKLRAQKELGFGEQLIIGRPLQISSLFGIQFDEVQVEPDIKTSGGGTSRCGVLLIRESKADGGAVIPVDRASRNSFTLNETIREAEHSVTFNPKGSLRRDGRFTGGMSELSE